MLRCRVAVGQRKEGMAALRDWLGAWLGAWLRACRAAIAPVCDGLRQVAMVDPGRV